MDNDWMIGIMLHVVSYAVVAVNIFLPLYVVYRLIKRSKRIYDERGTRALVFHILRFWLPLLFYIGCWIFGMMYRDTYAGTAVIFAICMAPVWAVMIYIFSRPRYYY